MRGQDDGSSWLPSYAELTNPGGWQSPDARQLAGHVKALGLGERDYQRMVTEALRLACSDEFVRLHRQLDHALRASDGRLDERDIAEAREKARQPEPPPPEDADRDPDGMITDAQVNADIGALRAARAIASYGDGGPSPAETKTEARKMGIKAFEAGKIEVASFTC